MSQPAWLGLPEGLAVASALRLGRLDAASRGLRSLLERFPDEPSLLYNFAVVASDVGWLDEAVSAYRRLAPVSASLRPRAVSGLLRVAQLSGDFAAIEGATEAAAHFLDRTIEAIDDVQILKFFAYRRAFTPTLDRFAARLERRIAALLPMGGPVPRPASSDRRRPDGRMTIGYLSSGFGDHPIGHVTRDLFAAHDRSGFRILGFSGRDRSAEAASFAATIRAGFDAFHEIGDLPPAAAAARIAAEGVEILVSLDQHMDWRGTTSAPEILALRPAPVQVAWLGVAAGTGRPCVDYLLADAVTVPAGEEGLYAETVLRLPGCYHCASPHAIADAVPSRAECGLPETGSSLPASTISKRSSVRLSMRGWRSCARCPIASCG
jgi:protein O-GlcNAc transferase